MIDMLQVQNNKIRIKANTTIEYPLPAGWGKGYMVEIDSWDDANHCFVVKKLTESYIDLGARVVVVGSDVGTLEAGEIAIADIGNVHFISCSTDVTRDYDPVFKEGDYFTSRYVGGQCFLYLYKRMGYIWGFDKNGKYIFRQDGSGWANSVWIDLPYIYTGEDTGGMNGRFRKAKIKKTMAAEVIEGNGVYFFALFRFQPLGYCHQVFSKSLGLIYKIVQDNAGNFVVCGWRKSGNTIWKYDDSGNLLWSYDAGVKAFGIAIDNSNNVYVVGPLDYDENAKAAVSWNYETFYEAGAETACGNAYYVSLQTHTSGAAPPDPNPDELPEPEDKPGVGDNWTDYWAYNKATLRKLSSSGALQWRKTPGTNFSPVAVGFDNNRIYVGGDGSDHTLLSLNNSGDFIWGYNTGGGVTAIAFDTVHHIYTSSSRYSHLEDEDGDIASVRKNLYSSGNKVWDYDTGSHCLDISVDQNDNNNVYAVGSSKLWKLEKDGDFVWNRDTGAVLKGVDAYKGIIAVCGFFNSSDWSL